MFILARLPRTGGTGINPFFSEHKCSINAAAEDDELGGVRLRLTEDCENNNSVLDVPIDACITTVNREEMVN